MASFDRMCRHVWVGNNDVQRQATARCSGRINVVHKHIFGPFPCVSSHVVSVVRRRHPTGVNGRKEAHR